MLVESTATEKINQEFFQFCCIIQQDGTAAVHTGITELKTAPLSDTVIAKAKELYDGGSNRLQLEEALKIDSRQSYRLICRFKADELVARDPSILTTVRELVEQGESKYAVEKQIGLPLDAVEHLITRAKNDIVDDELKLEEEPALAKQYARERRTEQRQRNLELVARLMSQGLGRIRIQRETGLTKAQVEGLMTEVRAQDFLFSKPLSKFDKHDAVKEILHEGGNIYQVARAVDATPGNAIKLVKRVQGNYSGPDEQLKMALAKGSSFIQLSNRFGIQTREQARELISELFPDCLLYEKELPNDDTGFTLIPDGSGHFDWLDANKNPKDFKFKVGAQNNYLFIQFNGERRKLRIYNFTDVHVGHKHFDRERFLAYVDLVANDPDAYVVLGGDIIEWAHKMSVGDPWEQVLSPMEQVSEAARLLMPIAHKILAYRSGNHDKGRGRITGTDLAEVLAHYLKVPYFKVETIIQIQLGGQLYTVSLDHGHSGSAIQNILRDAEKYKEYSAFFVHAHMSGHVHNSQIIKRIVKDLVVGQGFVLKRTFTIVGGSCVKFTETYAEEAKYAPTPQDLTYFECTADGAYDAGCIPADPV